MMQTADSTSERERQSISRACLAELGPVGLLTRSGLLNDETVSFAAAKSLSSRRPVEKVLVEEGCMSQDILQASVKLQSLVFQGRLTADQAILAIRRFAQNGQGSIAEIIQSITGQSSEPVNDLGLGALLLAANVITIETYRRAINEGAGATIPLGKTLLVLRALSLPTLDSALYLADRYQSSTIEWQEAVSAMKKAAVTNRPARELLRDSRLFGSSKDETPMLGGLLVDAGAVKESEMVESLELSMLHKHKLGEMLVNRGHVTQELVEGALKLQRMIVCGMLKIDDAVQCLKSAHFLSYCKEEIVKTAADLVKSFESATNLALSIGVLKSEVDASTRKTQEKTGLRPLEALFLTHDLPSSLYRGLVQASQLVDAGSIEQRQALQIVDFCERTRCTFDQAMDDLGVKVYAEVEPPVQYTQQTMDRAQRPRLLDSAVIVQLSGGLLGCVALIMAALTAMHGNMQIAAIVIAVCICLTSAVTVLIAARKRCEKEAYEQEVNAEAAIQTKAKLRTLRTGGYSRA